MKKAGGNYKGIWADKHLFRIFPGLWLDVQAFRAGKMTQVLAVLQQGLNSTEHADFVQKLAQKS